MPVRFARAARCGWRRSRTSVHVDTALAYYALDVADQFATCAKLFNHPDAAGAAGTTVIPEVVDRSTVSKDGRTYTFDLKRTFRFHTGAPVTAQSFADAFDRTANPKLVSPATSYMREIVGADAVIDGKATSISGIRVLGRYRLQIRLTKPLGDFTARSDAAVLLPGPPGHADRPAGIDDPAGSGPYFVAERVVNQRVVLKRNPYYRGDRPANVDQVVWTIGRDAGGVPARRRGEPDRPLRPLQHPRNRVFGTDREVRSQPAGRAILRHARARDVVPRLQPRPARVQRPGPDPAQEGDQLCDRPARARSHGRLPRRASAPTNAAARPRPPREHLPARRSGRRGRATLVREGATQAEQARPLHDSLRRRRPSGGSARVQPEPAGHRPRGEALRRRGPAREGRDPRRAVRPHRSTAGGPTTQTVPRSSSRS